MSQKTKLHRIIVATKGKPDVFTIYNLETADSVQDVSILHQYLCESLTERIVDKMPEGDFVERMYHNGVIDPAQESIQIGCRKLGIEVDVVKVGKRFYGQARQLIFVNKKVHRVYVNEEPILTTLKMRGSKEPMLWLDLTVLSDEELMKISDDNNLSLSLAEMRELVQIQRDLDQEKVNDVFLEIFAARWSDHCCHKKWRALCLLDILQDATKAIDNPNLVSAFVDNAGGWKFYNDWVLCLKLETHNSPTQMEPYGGQLTKLGGVMRDIIEFALGAKLIASLEMTVVGEFIRRIYKELEGQTLTAQIIARETIRAIADYGNRMGVPMLLARMFSHPNFGGKTFALGGSVGITKEQYAQKGKAQPGDLAVLVGRTGNDGLHGSTVSSGELTEKTDTGDECHVQLGNAYNEQKMMRAGVELRDCGCTRARTDLGAAGIAMAFSELGEKTGVLLNTAAVLLKCADLPRKVILLSESQERFAHAVIPEKLAEAIEIYESYGLEYAVIGVFTDNHRLQVIHDPTITSYEQYQHGLLERASEVIFDVPYSYLDRCPLPRIEVVAPPPKTEKVVFPKINLDNVEEMAVRVVGHFDVCDQSYATTQYDSSVQGISWQKPLYGRNYNVGSSLAVLTPVYHKNYGATFSMSFSPWQFEVDPVKAAINAVLDAVVTQVVAGVKLHDICLCDNFYTPHKDPYAYWYLREQVKAIAELSVMLKTPFITGKDSSSGSAVYKLINFIINVLPSVCITAMGKIENVDDLILHQWRKPGNLLYLVGPPGESLSGSILASSLGITGTKLDTMSEYQILWQMKSLSVARMGYFQSAVPINRGGTILRLFEGVEASGFGVETNLCEELFYEPFGSALVEIKPEHSNLNLFRGSLLVGEIVPEEGITVSGKSLDLQKLRNEWSTKFVKEVMS